MRSCPPSKLEPGEIAAQIASRRSARSWPTWSTVYPEAPMDLCQGLLASIGPDLEAELSANVTPVRVVSGVTSRHGRGWFPLQLGKRKRWAALKRGGCNGAEQLLLASLSKHRFESPLDVQHPTHSSAGHVSASWTRTLAEYMAARRSNRRIMGRAVRSGIMFQLTRAIAHANGMGVSRRREGRERRMCVGREAVLRSSDGLGQRVDDGRGLPGYRSVGVCAAGAACLFDALSSPRVAVGPRRCGASLRAMRCQCVVVTVGLSGPRLP